MNTIERGELGGVYGIDVMRRMQHLLEEYIHVRNKHVLVIGSILPWIETLLLHLDVGHITTLEYDPPLTTHPKITTIAPAELSALVMTGEAPMFDAMVSFSSLEHSGLGRYVIAHF